MLITYLLHICVILHKWAEMFRYIILKGHKSSGMHEYLGRIWLILEYFIILALKWDPMNLSLKFNLDLLNMNTLPRMFYYLICDLI